nr:transposase, Ptta/En/Spm [Tanacetum cinerariifolium]
MAQIEKVLSDSEARSSSADEKISEKRIEKANQQSKDFKNQNKDLKDKHDVLKNQATTFEMNNNELNEQLKVLIEKNDDLLAQTKLLKDQLQVKHVVIDTHVECQEKYAKLEAERYKYMIRYSAYFNNDKQHRKQIADQKVLYDKMSVQLVELDKHVRDLKNTVLEKDFKISKLKECSPSQMSHLSNIIEEVPQDPPKRTMITLDGGEFTGPKVVRKITSILKTMFNGSWSTWKEVDKSSRDELWAHFKEGLSDVLVYDAWENSIKKRYPDIKAKVESVKLAKTTGVQFEGADCTILKPYNLEWIKSNHWEDMIDRAAYNGALVEKYGSDPANHPIYDDDLWKQCARDDMKGGVFGWGSIVCGELKEELKEEIKADLKEEMKADLKEEMKNYLKEEMRKELKQETRKELKEEMHAQIQDMLVDYGINSRDTRQTKTKQDKKAIQKSKQETHMHQEGRSDDGAGLELEVLDAPKGKSIDTHEGTGLKPRVPDVSKADSSDSEYESWGVSDDDDQQGDDKKTEFDDDKSVDLNKIDDEEEIQENEFAHTPDDYVPMDDETYDVDDEEYDRINEEMYDDVNVELKDAELANVRKGDEETTDAEKVNTNEEVNQEVASAQLRDEAKATITIAPAQVAS